MNVAGSAQISRIKRKWTICSPIDLQHHGSLPGLVDAERLAGCRRPCPLFLDLRSELLGPTEIHDLTGRREPARNLRINDRRLEVGGQLLADRARRRWAHEQADKAIELVCGKAGLA